MLPTIEECKAQTNFKIMCPEGLQAYGQSWYRIGQGGYAYQSKRFVICVKCQPHTGRAIELIEVCLAKDDDVLTGVYDQRNDNCEEVNMTYFKISRSCPMTQDPVCGLSVNFTKENLGKTLEDSSIVKCNNKTNHRELKNQTDVDLDSENQIELECPEESKPIGLEKFGILHSVVALLCQPYNEPFSKYLIYINAFGMKKDIPFNKSSNCPDESVEALDRNRCSLKENENKFCGLRWQNPGKNNSRLEFTLCAKAHESVETVASLVGIIVFIILAVITVIIALSVYIIKVKKSKENNRKAKSTTNIEMINYEEITNPYYSVQDEPNQVPIQLEIQEGFSVNPYYESSPHMEDNNTTN